MKDRIFKEHLRAWTSVVRTYQSCNDTLIAELAPLDLKLPQFEVLVRLLYQPEQTQQQLAANSFVVKSHMSLLITDMADRGWLKRNESAHDKRIKIVSLTARGTALAKKAADIQTRVVETMLEPLSNQQIVEIELAMNSVAHALDNYNQR
jgi:MarR family transcriptional regulator, organic hydroperoxide resistance regulator